MTKISHSIIHPTVDFLRVPHSRAETGRKRDREDLQFSMGRQYGHPACLHRRQNVVLTNPQMYLSFFFLSFCESFSLNVFFFFFCVLHANAALWQSAHCLPVFEQLVCPGPVPDAVDLSASPYTRDEQVAASEQTPAQKFWEGRGPRRNIKADMMLYLQSHGWNGSY